MSGQLYLYDMPKNMCLYFLLCIWPVTLMVNLNDIDFYYEGDEDNGNNDYDFYYEGDEDDGNYILLLFVFDVVHW